MEPLSDKNKIPTPPGTQLGISGSAKVQNFVGKNEDEKGGDAKASSTDETRLSTEILRSSTGKVADDYSEMGSNHHIPLVINPGPGKTEETKVDVTTPTETPAGEVELSGPVPKPLQEMMPQRDRPTVFAEGDEHNEHVRGVRTFSSDMAEAMRETKGSIIKIAIAEDERRRADQKEIEAAPRKNLMYFLGGIIIFALAIGGIYGIIWYKNKISVKTPVEEVVIPPSVIRSEDAITLDITGKLNNDVVPAIRTIVANPEIRPGTVKNIILAKKSDPKATATRITAVDFLKILHSHAPAQFGLSLSKDFMVGVYLYTTEANPFFVIKGSAHDYLLSGMISWEPFLLTDMAPLFGVKVTGDQAYLTDIPFKDTLVQNRNARAVVGKDGKPVLFYSFLDPNTIFIATDPKTLLEGVRRFNGQ